MQASRSARNVPRAAPACNKGIVNCAALAHNKGIANCAGTGLHQRRHVLRVAPPRVLRAPRPAAPAMQACVPCGHHNTVRWGWLCVGVGCVLRGWVCWLCVACHSGITTRAALRTSGQPAFFFGSLATRREAGSSDLEEAARIHPTRKFIRPFLDHFIRPILDRLFDRFSAVLSDRSSTVYSTVSRPFYSTVLFDRLPTVHLFDRFLRSQVFTDLAPAPSSTRPTAQRLPNKDQPRRHCSYAPPPHRGPTPHTRHTHLPTHVQRPRRADPPGVPVSGGGGERGGERNWGTVCCCGIGGRSCFCCCCCGGGGSGGFSGGGGGGGRITMYVPCGE